MSNSWWTTRWSFERLPLVHEFWNSRWARDDVEHGWTWHFKHRSFEWGPSGKRQLRCPNLRKQFFTAAIQKMNSDTRGLASHACRTNMKNCKNMPLVVLVPSGWDFRDGVSAVKMFLGACGARHIHPRRRHRFGAVGSAFACFCHPSCYFIYFVFTCFYCSNLQYTLQYVCNTIRYEYKYIYIYIDRERDTMYYITYVRYMMILHVYNAYTQKMIFALILYVGMLHLTTWCADERWWGRRWWPGGFFQSRGCSKQGRRMPRHAETVGADFHKVLRSAASWIGSWV